MVFQERLSLHSGDGIDVLFFPPFSRFSPVSLVGSRMFVPDKRNGIFFWFDEMWIVSVLRGSCWQWWFGRAIVPRKRGIFLCMILWDFSIFGDCNAFFFWLLSMNLERILSIWSEYSLHGIFDFVFLALYISNSFVSNYFKCFTW